MDYATSELVKAAIDTGRERERADVVAWLRSFTDDPHVVNEVADAVERGDHEGRAAGKEK